MGKYAVRRLLFAVPTVLGMVLLVFFVARVIPSDPAEVMLGAVGGQEQIEELRERLGLDQPLIVQLGMMLRDYATGDLGRSIQTNRLVAEEILLRFPYTAALAVAGMSMSIVVGVTLGIVAAIRRGGFLDMGVLALSTVGIAAPAFWVALLLMGLFSVKLGWFPTIGAGSLGDWPSLLRALVLPAVTLGLAGMAFIARMTRSAMLDVLGEDYIRTARAKGLAERVVLFRHALKNAAIPTVTVIGFYFGLFLAGAIITETVFARPGLGKFLVDGIYARDYPVIQGTILFIGLSFVIVNLVTDLIYSVLDPRVRQQ